MRARRVGGWTTLDLVTPPSHMPDDRLAEATDVRIVSDGSLVQRRGDAVIAVAASPVVACHEADVAGHRYLFFATDEGIYAVDRSGSVVKCVGGLRGQGHGQFLRFRDQLLYANGVDNVKRFRLDTAFSRHEEVLIDEATQLREIKVHDPYGEHIGSVTVECDSFVRLDGSLYAWGLSSQDKYEAAIVVAMWDGFVEKEYATPYGVVKVKVPKYALRIPFKWTHSGAAYDGIRLIDGIGNGGYILAGQGTGVYRVHFADGTRYALSPQYGSFIGTAAHRCWRYEAMADKVFGLLAVGGKVVVACCRPDFNHYNPNDAPVLWTVSTGVDSDGADGRLVVHDGMVYAAVRNGSLLRVCRHPTTEAGGGGPVWWHRLESPTAQPEIGSSSTFGSPQQTTGRWGNGIALRSYDGVVGTAQVRRATLSLWEWVPSSTMVGVTTRSYLPSGTYRLMLINDGVNSISVEIVGIINGFSNTVMLYRFAYPSQPPYGKWTHWAIVFDNDAPNRLRLFCDGVELALQGKEIDHGILGAWTCHVGPKMYGGPYDYSCRADNWMLYDRVLTDDEIAWLASREMLPFGAAGGGLVSSDVGLTVSDIIGDMWVDGDRLKVSLAGPDERTLVFDRNTMERLPDEEYSGPAVTVRAGGTFDDWYDLCAPYKPTAVAAGSGGLVGTKRYALTWVTNTRDTTSVVESSLGLPSEPVETGSSSVRLMLDSLRFPHPSVCKEMGVTHYGVYRDDGGGFGFVGEWPAYYELAGNIDASATKLAVKESYGVVPKTPFGLQIGGEVVKVVDATPTELTVVRGQDGTEAAPHFANDYAVLASVDDTGYDADPSDVPTENSYLGPVSVLAEYGGRLCLVGHARKPDSFLYCGMDGYRMVPDPDVVREDAWYVVGSDKEPLTAAHKAQNSLILFKPNSMWAFGGDITNGALSKVLDIGTRAPKSVVGRGGVLYFMSDEGLQAYHGGLPKNLTGRLLDPLVAAIDWSKAWRVAATVMEDRNELWVSVPLLDGTERTVVFNFGRSSLSENGPKVFTLFSSHYNCYGGIVVDGVLRTVGGGDNGVYLLDDERLPYGGSPRVVTGNLLRPVMYGKTLRRVAVEHVGDGNGGVVVGVIADGAETPLGTTVARTGGVASGWTADIAGSDVRVVLTAPQGLGMDRICSCYVEHKTQKMRWAEV